MKMWIGRDRPEADEKTRQSTRRKPVDRYGEWVAAAMDERKPIECDKNFALLTFNEPRTYTEAMQCDDANDWKTAMANEIESLKENDIWDLVPKPGNRKVLSCKWVYRVKMDENGEVDKFKARLVARRFSQEAGIDYFDTFSPVTRFETIRAMISVAAKENKLAHFDVKTAFLYGDLDEVMYMSQPEGYVDGSERVCKLKKSLYGLKQSLRCWNKKFTLFLSKHGFQQSEADPCLYIRSSEGRKLMLALYVDDGLVAIKKIKKI